MSKLYTEEQVRIMLGKARMHKMDDTEMFTDDYLIEQQTPIELPTDEDIHRNRPYESISEWGMGFYSGWKEGAKWMRDKIKGGNK